MQMEKIILKQTSFSFSGRVINLFYEEDDPDSSFILMSRLILRFEPFCINWISCVVIIFVFFLKNRPAAELLCRYIEYLYNINSNFIKNKVIVELGAGLGIFYNITC